MERIANHQATVVVVGLGYVGLPFAVEKAKVGFNVIGLDRNEMRVRSVNGGENYISDVSNEELKRLVETGKLSANTDFDVITNADVIVICVPTPLTKNLTPDLQYVESVTRSIGERIKPGQLISLESTTYPGTTEEIMLPILEASGLEADKDFFLAHSPERVDPGNQRYTTKNTSKVVGGIGPNSLEVARLFYEQTIQHVVPVGSAKAAELTKVFENTFRAVNIALVNELTLLCDRMGLDVWEVLDASFTKPFGIMPFYPGPGVGGHCIPIDPHYLEWKAKELNFNTHFIALAGEINRSMPEFVVDKTARILNDFGKSIRGSKIVVLGAAYKANLADWRESPAIEVMKLMSDRGADISYNDPYVPEFSEHGLSLKSEALTEELLASSDIVVVLTNHKDFDYDWILNHAPHVFDTRNALKNVEQLREKVTLL